MMKSKRNQAIYFFLKMAFSSLKLFLDYSIKLKRSLNISLNNFIYLLIFEIFFVLLNKKLEKNLKNKQIKKE